MGKAYGHVVVVVADPPPADLYWMRDAYVARQLSGGTLTWNVPDEKLGSDMSIDL